MAADRGESGDALLSRHGAHNPAHNRVRWPATLGTPVAWLDDVWAGHARVHEIDPGRLDATGYERVSHGARDRDKARNPPTVLQPASGHEWDASRHHERQRSPTDQSGERDGVGARVMRVYDVRVPCAQDGAHAPCGCQVPVAAHAHGGDGDSGRAQTSDEWRIGGRDHQRLVTLLTLPAREQVHLPLSTAPFSA